MAANDATRDISLEELRETLVDLERARRHEQQLRFESEGLLEGLTALTEARDTGEVFDKLSRVLRRFVPFEEAFILLATGAGTFRPLRATSPLFADLEWRSGAMLQRVLDGQIVCVFDIAHLPEWQEQPTAVRARVRSVIHAPLCTETLSAVLVFVHAQPAFFTGDHVRLLERLAPLCNQALASIDYRQRLEEQTKELRAAQDELVATARQAGMAEIATNVLHNVGNVLNSVNVSTGVVSSQVRNSKAAGLSRAVQLLEAHAGDLGNFLTHDEKGRRLPEYLKQLAAVLAAEQTAILEELGELGKSVEHIKDIVATQQSYAGASRLVEPVQIRELVDDALRMNAGALMRHDVTVIKECAEVPLLPLDRHRVLQILVNLISNAKQAMDATTKATHRMTLRVGLVASPHPSDRTAGRHLQICVADEGDGISAENLRRIFNHGFTTRRSGHGFGLHSCALAAREMGGTLTAQSDGPGLGACFTLDLPINEPGSA